MNKVLRYANNVTRDTVLVSDVEPLSTITAEQVGAAIEGAANLVRLSNLIFAKRVQAETQAALLSSRKAFGITLPTAGVAR